MALHARFDFAGRGNLFAVRSNGAVDPAHVRSFGLWVELQHDEQIALLRCLVDFAVFHGERVKGIADVALGSNATNYIALIYVVGFDLFRFLGDPGFFDDGLADWRFDYPAEDVVTTPLFRE